MSKRRFQGFTLLECLVVIAIIGLLAALLFQVFGLAKIRSNMAVATLEGRQIATALMMYKDTNEKYPHGDLSILVDSGYLTSSEILMAPGDPIKGGYYKRIIECQEPDISVKYPQSYEYYYLGKGGPVETYVQMLSKLDSNPGVLALRIYGDQFYPLDACEAVKTSMMFYGTMIRFREDTSAENTKFNLRYSDDGTTISWKACILAKFTDHPDACDPP